MLLNPQFVLLAVSVLPELIAAISETVQAVQVSFSNASPEVKKQEALQAACAWYDAADENLKFSDAIDAEVKGHLLPGLIEFVYKGMKHTPEQEVHLSELEGPTDGAQ
jgi:hypothetical protein